jgi:toxin YoeB
MEIEYTLRAQEDIAHWKKSGNVKIQKKISELLLSIQNSPTLGIGKPEALKYDLSGLWSRRINREHRLIYQIKDSIIYVISLRGHYN